MATSTSDRASVLRGLLQCWIVGPLWGANIVLCALAARQLLAPSVSRSRRRLLLATITAFSMISCAHAIVSLADLISGFSSGLLPFLYFGNPQRGLFIAKVSLYFVNSVIADLFVAWRAYVAWDRNKLIAVSASAITLANIAVGVAGLVKQSPTAESETDEAIIALALRLFSSSWGLSLALQCGCSLLIGWRKISTPVTVRMQNVDDIRTPAGVFWIVVESGILYGALTLTTWILTYTLISIGDILTGLLGQATVLVPVSIMLREAWKTEHVRRDTVNAQTFVVEDRAARDQIDSLEFNDNSIADQAHPGVFVRVKVSTHGDLEA